MKKILLYIFSITILTCCAESGKNRYKISGSLPGNTYDNEWIYLAPLKVASAEAIDSVKVKDGTFRFEGVVDTPEIYILRTQSLPKFKIQQLLIVLEQGTLNVSLDSVSSAQGTPQNDILQQWKEEKMKNDNEILLLSKQRMDADTTPKADLIDQQYEQIKTRFSEYNYNLVKASGFNAVGSFIYEISGQSFTSEQKEELEKLKN
jgi:hypothetical protein